MSSSAPISPTELDEWDDWLDRWFQGEFNPKPDAAPPEMVSLAHSNMRLIAEVRRLRDRALILQQECDGLRTNVLLWQAEAGRLAK